MRIEKRNDKITWYLDDKKHRLDGPAVEYTDGSQIEWWVHGVLHRENAPAIITKISEGWWVQGCQHREDGPAVHWGDGTQAWYFKNRLHREDGPAVVTPRGSRNEHNTLKWFIHGKCIESFCDQYNLPYTYNDWPLEFKILWKLKHER